MIKSSQKITFENSRGEKLSARIAFPIDRKPHNFAVFANCFTSNKNFKAIRYITQSLTAEGFGVLSFDFTGLGESEGNFAGTAFSSSVDDLICAANYLKENYVAPTLIVGHSLGGAAVILAASQVDEIKAVVTSGTPSARQHVRNLLKSGIEEIEENGVAEVDIGGRPFTVKKEFIDDLVNQKLPGVVKQIRKSYLGLHSAQDTIVGIENESELYLAVRHPRSFISPDGADHLLSKEKDACCAGDLIVTWAKRYVEIPEIEELSTQSRVVAYLDTSEKFTTHIKADQRSLIADEPENFGANVFGPSPYQLVASGLATCTLMTLHLYAELKKWDLQEVFRHIRHETTHLEDWKDCENPKAQIDKFTRDLELIGDLDVEQKQKLLEVSGKCPVHQPPENVAHIETRMI